MIDEVLERGGRCMSFSIFSLSLSLPLSLILSLPLSSFPFFLTSQRVQHDERRVPQPHQRLRDLDPDLLERVERVPQDLGAAPAEEQRDEAELQVDGPRLQERDGPRRAGDGGEVDDAPEGPDARQDLDDCFCFQGFFMGFFLGLRGG